MKYKAKSVMVGRVKDKENEDYPYFIQIKLFNVNDAHKTTEVPTKILEYHNAMSVVMTGIPVKYLPRGSDLILNDVEEVEVEEVKKEGDHGSKILVKVL